MSVRAKSTPLYVWAWVGGLFLLLQIIVHVYCHNIPNTDKLEFDGLYEEMKEDFQSSKKRDLKVIFVGSSLAKYGIQCPDEIYAYSNRLKKSPILLSKMYGNGEPFKRMVTTHQLLPKIAALNPDLVCIQTELAVVNLENVGAKYKADSTLKAHSLKGQLEMRSWLNRRFFKEMLGMLGYKQKMDCVAKAGPSIQHLDTLSYVPQKRISRSFEELGYAHEELQMLRDQGIKIVFVDVPQPAALMHQIYPPKLMQEQAILLEQYQEQLGIEYWPYTGSPLGYKYFWDYSHLTTAGQEIYTEWLIDKIVAERKN
ncbi:MAG: hypothetical protein R8P61_34900 [Bacteroidia bacterium]|nr:hypothetical protein [Bacteroidia bacterium]